MFNSYCTTIIPITPPSAATRASDSQCPTGQTCVNGACVIATVTTTTCASDSDCATGQTCVNSYCATIIPITPPTAATCTSDSQCSNGQTCVNGSCATTAVPTKPKASPTSVTPTPTPSVAQSIINTLLGITPPKKATPQKVISIPKEVPQVLQHKWNLLPVKLDLDGIKTAQSSKNLTKVYRNLIYVVVIVLLVILCF